jgi:predicted  nucleic acid-binding Zn-ribbon protein
MIEKDDWDVEWDRMSHSTFEYQLEIRDLRERIAQYLKQIEDLQVQLHAANVDWIKSQDEILHLREKIKALRDG